MLYWSMEVQKMRLQITSSKNSKSLYAVKTTYDKNKRKSNMTVKKFGSMSVLLQSLNLSSEDEAILWAKEQVRQMTEEEKVNKGRIAVNYSQEKPIDYNEQNLFNIGYSFLQSIYYDLGLHKICKEIQQKHKYDFDFNQILSHLVYSRILHPCSKKATFEYANQYLEPLGYDLHHIYRALEILAKEKDLVESSLYENSKKILNRNTGILYYDCTNFFFEINEEEGLKQYGKSKENRPNPIVQMGLFLDGDGIPLAFDITAGNKNEQTTLRPLEERILKDFGDVKKFVVCTDAGLNSNANRKFNTKCGRSFIVTESLKKQKKHVKERVFSENQWYYFNAIGNQTPITLDTTKYDIAEMDKRNQKISKEYNKLSIHTIFYKELFTNEAIEDQRIIVTFSLPYKLYAQKIRSKQIERATKKIEQGGKYKKRASTNSPDRFIVVEQTTEDGEIANKEIVYLHEEKIKSEAMYDGLYGISTTLEDEDVREIIRISHRRWEIEESFYIMKSEFCSRPVFLQNDDRIIAHFITCYLSLFIFRVLEKKLKEQYTSHEIIDKLRKMQMYRIKGQGYAPAYVREKLTDDLHDVFGFRTDFEIVSGRQMKKILRDTKK